MSDISREELLAFTEAHTKTALALETMVQRLEDIIVVQNKLCDKFDNGFYDKITAHIAGNPPTTIKEVKVTLESIDAKLNTQATKLEDQSKSWVWMKIIWGSLTAIIAIGMVFLEIVRRKAGP